MAPPSGAPRELLWYHQIQRENRHLLERLNKQQADIDQIKNQWTIDQRRAEQTQQIISELQAKQVTTIQRRREEFEREKEILKRVGELEESVKTLREANDSQPMVTGLTTQGQALEQRIHVAENRQTTATDRDMQQLKSRIDVMDVALNNISKSPAGEVQQLSIGKQATSSAVTTAKPAVAGPSKEGGAKEADVQETASGRKQPISKRPPILAQLGRRPEREQRIPFRPTPPDMW